MSITYTGQAEIKHINLRKEGATEDKTLAADIKLVFVTDADFVAPFGAALKSLLWNETGSPRIPGMAPVEFEGKIKGLSVALAHQKVKFSDAEGKKFVFEPMHGHRLDVSMSVAVVPLPDQTSALANLLAESVFVEIFPEADLFSAEKAVSETVRLSPDALHGVRRAVENLRNLADRDGTTLTISTPGGEPVTIAPRGKAEKKAAAKDKKGGAQ